MVVFVDVSGQSVAEQTARDNFLEFTVSLSEASAQTITLPYRYYGGTAVFGAQSGDFSSSNAQQGVLTFSPGELQETVRVRIEADAVPEPDEAVILEVGKPTNAALLDNAGVARAVGWILDDDGYSDPTALHVSSPRIYEGDGGTTAAVFAFELSRPAQDDLSFSYEAVPGTASISDFVGKSGTLIISEGQSTGTVTVAAINDNAAEGLERFDLGVALPNEVANSVGGQATIVDDDAGGPVVLISADSVAEQNTTDNFMTLTVQLSESSATQVTVPYRYFSGTAIYGSQTGDFSTSNAQSGTLTFSPGETQETVRVRIEADAVAEPDESIMFEVGAPSGGGARLPGNATMSRTVGWILDDDGTPNPLALAVLDPVVVEGSGTTTTGFEFDLSRPAPSDLTIGYTANSGSATPGSDYVAETGNVVIRKGQQTAGIDLVVNASAAVEGLEYVDLSLALPAPIRNSAGGQATVVDDDASTLPVVQVHGQKVVEQDITDNFMLFIVSLSKPATTNVSVSYTYYGGTAVFGSNGGDFSTSNAQSGNLAFRPGETQKTVRVRIEADSTPEPDESILFEVATPNGAVLPGGAIRSQAIGWIMDDDGATNPISLQVRDSSLREGNTGSQTASFDFELSRPATSDLAIAYTTTGSGSPGGDYIAAAGSVAIARGQHTASLGVDVLGDFLGEQPETVALALTAPPGRLAALDGGTLTIIDNDPGDPGDGPFFQNTGKAAAAYGATSGWVTFRHERTAADVNGDGRADLIGFGDGGVLVSLAQPGGVFFAAPKLATPAYGALSGWTSRAHERLMGDVNNDGRADIVGFGDGGVSVSFGQANGTFAAPKAATPAFGTLSGWSVQVHERELGDVNGDGRLDIVGFADGGVLVAQGRGDGTFAGPYLASNAFGALSGWTARVHERDVADVNGDGRADIVGFDDGGVLVALAAPNGRFTAPALTTEAFGLTSGWRTSTYERTTGDVNGDGRADLVGFGATETLLSFAAPDGDFDIISLGSPTYDLQGGFRVSTHERLLADTNGDGRDDIVAFGDSGVFLGLSFATPDDFSFA
jgi:hypothetical protein